jgi:hypothetical protein
MTHSQEIKALIALVHDHDEAALSLLLYNVYDDSAFDQFPGKPWPPRFDDLSADDLGRILTDAHRLSLLPEHTGGQIIVSVPDHIVRAVSASA